MTTIDAYDEIAEAMKDLGFEESDQVFSTERIPPGVKHRTFVIVPSGIRPASAARGSFEMSVTWEVRVLYHTTIDSVRAVVRDLILADLDKILVKLLPLAHTVAVTDGRVEPDVELDFLVLALVCEGSYCAEAA
jgi:hypothetical protein